LQHLVDVTPILENLNDAQREAVTAPAEPTLVIAGAGSGKTRVLVHRAAWLIDVEGLSPQSLLAVTFTNKAAAEMRGRIEALLDMPVAHLWIGTFHGLAHRLLRRHWREAGLPQNFQIIDSDDQLRLIKRLLKNLEIDDSRWVPREIQYFINGQKDEGLRGALRICSWTSSRTRTPFNTPGCGCWRVKRASRSWSATTISLSIAGAAPGSSISIVSRKTFRRRG
jgi:superfamily I DNA/RNA helicase